MAFGLRHPINSQHADVQCDAPGVAGEGDDFVSTVLLFVHNECAIRSALAFGEGDAEAVRSAGKLDGSGGGEVHGAQIIFRWFAGERADCLICNGLEP